MLNQIETSDIYGGDRKVILDSHQATFHPFGLIWHEGSLMWTDWQYSGIGVSDEDYDEAWPKNYVVGNILSNPVGIHVYDG